MIVTILPSSSNFHAVGYNENKVAKGEAFLMEIKNFEDLNTFGYDKPDDLIEFLTDYSARNPNIRKPQLHVAISCKGQEMSHEELLDFAHEYLKEMGYGDPEQPLLVYAHNDTDNNHIHVITSRVDPKGHKINHNNERRRSQKVIEKLLGQDEKLKLEKYLREIKDFNYRSVTQYRSILEALGYECYEKNGQLNVKKGGMVLRSIDYPIIEKYSKINESSFEEPDYKKLFGIFSKYRDMNSDIEGVRKDLRKKFGLELVFFGRKDSPYGYVIVDFKNKSVYEGSRVMSIKRLNKFQSPEERKSKIEQFIYQTLLDSPDISQKELNNKLNKYNAYISKGNIVVGNTKTPLSESILNQLSINNKLEWINSFHPQSDDEFRILYKFSGLDETKIKFPEFYKFQSYNQNVIRNVLAIFKFDDKDKIKDELANAGYRIYFLNKNTYLYSSRDRAIINLDKVNIKLPESLRPKNNTSNQSQNSNISVPKNKLLSLVGDSSSAHGTNREWEVGKKEYNPDDLDNQNQIKY